MSEMIRKDPLIGTELAGCKILQKLGSGGTSTVYKAHHAGLDKIVCVKILSPLLASDERYVKSFLREAHSAAKLEHPNIVQVHNAGKERNFHFLVMSYIDGKPLSDIISQTGPLTLNKAVEILKEMLKGLSEAHKHAIIHRDIKPSNILIARNGEIKIVDFGLARNIKDEKHLTIAGEMVGTAYFIAPEQSMGKKVDSRADLYSTGATFFYMLTARHLFEGESAIEVMHKHISEYPPEILTIRPELPRWVSQFISKTLNKYPQDRYQTASEMIDFISTQDTKTSALEKTEISEVLKISKIPPKTDYIPTNAKEIEDAISALPNMCTMNEAISEEIEKLQQKYKQDKKNLPPRKTGIIKRTFQKTRTRLFKISPVKRKWDLNSFFYPLLFLCIFIVFLALGCESSSRIKDVQKNFSAFFKPWLLLPLSHLQIYLLITGLLTLIPIFIRPPAKSLLNMLLVFLTAAAAYFAGLTGTKNISETGLFLKMTTIFENYFANFGSPNHNLIYGVICFFASWYLLTKKTKKQIALGFILAIFSIMFMWFFCSPTFYSINEKALTIFLFSGIFFLAFAVTLGIMKGNYFAATSGPGISLFLSLLAIWFYAASPNAKMLVSKIEFAAKDAAVLKDTSSKVFVEISTYNKSKDKANNYWVEIPKDQSFSDIKEMAWLLALSEPLLRFKNDVYRDGSFLIFSLFIFFLTNALFFYNIRPRLELI